MFGIWLLRRPCVDGRVSSAVRVEHVRHLHATRSRAHAVARLRVAQPHRERHVGRRAVPGVRGQDRRGASPAGGAGRVERAEWAGGGGANGGEG